MGKPKSIFKDKRVQIIIIIAIALIAIILAWGISKTLETDTVSSEIEEKKEIKNVGKAFNVKSIDDKMLKVKIATTGEVKTNPKEIIRIKKVKTSTPNSAGGVDLDINWVNMSDKIIKYITFTTYPINAVGDVVECTIRTQNMGQFRAQETGPISKGQGNKAGYVWENAWYNYSIVRAIVMQVDIEYMDGTAVMLGPLDVDEVSY